MRLRFDCRGTRFGQAARLVVLLLAAGVAGAAPQSGSVAAASRVPQPAVERGAGERCVEDTPFMRRNHMELLKHHRNETVREGIRTTRHSFANCVTCHAGRKTGRVTGEGGFCQGCHSYAGVALDCFECHADKPAPPMAEMKR